MLLQTSKAQKAADNRFVEEGGDIKELIRSAAEGLAERVLSRVSTAGFSGPVVIFAGKGNNGSDGIAAAEILANKGIEVKLFNLAGPVCTMPEESLAGMIREAVCVVDCIFGTGFDPKREPPADIKKLIDLINENSRFTVSADVPSGVSADTGERASSAIKANETVTFGAPKPGHFILPGKLLTGRLTLKPILIKKGLTSQDAPELLSRADKEFVLSLLPGRDPYGNKYSNGRVLVIAGSKKYAGAAILAVSSSLRSGAGLVTSAAPGAVIPEITAACPEAVRMPLGGLRASSLGLKNLEAIIDASAASDSVVIGPGLGRTPGTVKCVIEFLKNTNCKRIVADADALYALSADPSIKADLFDGKEAVLTPHAGEAARLLGVSSDEIGEKRLSSAKALSEKYGAAVVLKGNDTLTVDPSGRFSINNTGNTALSKGGSGDVLAGLIGSLLASGMNAYDAGRTGAFIHGLAAETLSEKMTEYGVLPGDLPLAFHDLMC